MTLGRTTIRLCCAVTLFASGLALAGASTPSGVVQTDEGSYNFIPRTCAVHIENGEPDIEVSGAGTSPDGEKIFVDFSSIADELSIKLGVDQPFASSDRALKAGQYVTEKLVIEVSGTTIRVSDLVLADASGTRRTGSLEINCAPRS